MRFFVTFPFLNQLSSNLVQRLKIGCSFLFWAQEVVLEAISDNMAQSHCFMSFFFGKGLLEIVLPQEHLRSQMIKDYLKGCVIC